MCAHFAIIKKLNVSFEDRIFVLVTQCCECLVPRIVFVQRYCQRKSRNGLTGHGTIMEK